MQKLKFPKPDFAKFRMPRENGITPAAIMNEPEKCLQKAASSIGFFTIQSANKWIEGAKNRLVPSMLFSEFWFEGELCFLFADTNCGKTALAVQIANSITKGTHIYPFKMEASAEKSQYMDFELSDKQFEARYSKDFKDHYTFSDNFLRSEINPESDLPDNMDADSFLGPTIEQSIIRTGAKILIVDNITYLRNDTERSRGAIPLMKYLKKLKQKYGLSILVIAHTPKRDMSKPLSRNDLAGSKMLINFCDSAFTIGESFHDKCIRFIKQIKARNTEVIYNTDNVVLCQIKKSNNFLLFEFYGFGREIDHLKPLSDKDRNELEANIIDMKKSDPTTINRGHARKLNTNPMRVGRVLIKNDDETLSQDN